MTRCIAAPVVIELPLEGLVFARRKKTCHFNHTFVDVAELNEIIKIYILFVNSILSKWQEIARYSLQECDKLDPLR